LAESEKYPAGQGRHFACERLKYSPGWQLTPTKESAAGTNAFMALPAELVTEEKA